jgi:elongation factor 1-beta
MANMLASFKILPTETNIDIKEFKETLLNSLPTGVKLHKINEEPIAFGLVSVIIHLIMDEKNRSIMEDVETVLKQNEKVSEIQVTGMTRLD